MRKIENVILGTPVLGTSPDTKRGSRSYVETTVAEIDRAHDELFAVNSRLEEMLVQIL